MRDISIYVYSPSSPSAETFPSASIVRNLPVLADRKRQTVAGVGAAKAVNAIIDSRSETIVGIFIVGCI